LGVIYVLLEIFVYSQALSNRQAEELRERIGYLFAASCALNTAWLFLWQFEYLVPSVAVMFLLLASLIAIYLRLGVATSELPARIKIGFHVPFSIYLGWITIATIANVAVTLVSINWDGFGISPEAWAVTIIIIALLITELVALTRKDIAFGLVVVWALLGIAVNQSKNQSIVAAAVVSAAMVAATLVAKILHAKLRR